MSRSQTPLFLRLRVLIHVMLCRPPDDWRGSFGKRRRSKWVYECKHEQCTHTRHLPERVTDNEIPWCQFGHGRMRLSPQKDDD